MVETVTIDIKVRGRNAARDIGDFAKEMDNVLKNAKEFTKALKRTDTRLKTISKNARSSALALNKLWRAMQRVGQAQGNVRLDIVDAEGMKSRMAETELQVRNYRREIAQLTRQLRNYRRETRGSRNETDRFRKTIIGMGSALRGAGFLGSIVAISNFAAEMTIAADSIRLLEARLTALQGSAFVAGETLSRLNDIAVQNGVDVRDLSKLYIRTSRAIESFGGEQSDAFLITERLSESIRLFGLSAQETRSVIIQFSQALQSGRLQGDEFRSLSEALPPILDSIAKVMGVTRGELKQLGSEGKITFDILAEAAKNIDVSGVENVVASLEGSITALGVAIAGLGAELIPTETIATGFQGIATALNGIAEALRRSDNLEGLVAFLNRFGDFRGDTAQAISDVQRFTKIVDEEFDRIQARQVGGLLGGAGILGFVSTARGQETRSASELLSLVQEIEAIRERIEGRIRTGDASAEEIRLLRTSIGLTEELNAQRERALRLEEQELQLFRRQQFLLGRTPEAQDPRLFFRDADESPFDMKTIERDIANMGRLVSAENFAVDGQRIGLRVVAGFRNAMVEELQTAFSEGLIDETTVRNTTKALDELFERAVLRSNISRGGPDTLRRLTGPQGPISQIFDLPRGSEQPTLDAFDNIIDKLKEFADEQNLNTAVGREFIDSLLAQADSLMLTQDEVKELINLIRTLRIEAAKTSNTLTPGMSGGATPIFDFTQTAAPPEATLDTLIQKYEQIDDIQSGIRVGFLNFLEESQFALNQFGQAAFASFTTMADGVADAAAQAIVMGDSFSQAFKRVAQTILTDLIAALIKLAIQVAVLKALDPTGVYSSAIGATGGEGGGFGALGSFFDFFANGGVVNSPTAAVIGEAGSEAVLPLSRSGGTLGVNASGIGGTTVIVNNTVAGVEATATTRQMGDEEIIEVAVNRSRSAVRQDFDRELAVDQGGYADTINRSYSMTRKF